MSDHILIVEDEPSILELFNIVLRMAGFKTQTAKNGREAMQVIAQSPPALILLDLMMPYVNGFEVLENLRGDDELLGVRVLVVTAKTLVDSDRKKLTGWPVVGTVNKGELDIAYMVGIVQEALTLKPPVTVSDTPSGSLPAREEQYASPVPAMVALDSHATR
jgi:CheY-like chemotaxis protein